jgi:hypothetical protein
MSAKKRTEMKGSERKRRMGMEINKMKITSKQAQHRLTQKWRGDFSCKQATKSRR